jgi:chorismate mutase
MMPPADAVGWAGRERPLALAAVLLLVAPLAGSPAPQVRGTVYEGDPSHPAAGVLIAFYDAGDLLLDSTYSRDDGGFRLQTPPGGGPFYVIATRGGDSLRKDFTFDPLAGRTRNLALVLPRQSWLVRAGGWVLDKFGAVVGLLVGYLFRSLFEDRLAAKSKRDFFLSDVRAAIDVALAKYPRHAQELPQQRTEIEDAVRSIAQLLDRRGDVQDALAKLHRNQGRQSFRALQARIGDIAERLRQAAAEPDIPLRRLLTAVNMELLELKERPLG